MAKQGVTWTRTGSHHSAEQKEEGGGSFLRDLSRFFSGEADQLPQGEVRDGCGVSGGAAAAAGGAVLESLLCQAAVGAMVLGQDPSLLSSTANLSGAPPDSSAELLRRLSTAPSPAGGWDSHTSHLHAEQLLRLLCPSWPSPAAQSPPSHPGSHSVGTRSCRPANPG